MKLIREKPTAIVFFSFTLIFIICSDAAWAGPRYEKTVEKRELCNSYCESHEECVLCSTSRHCGGYERLASWYGRGENIHACGTHAPDMVSGREAASLTNRQQCEEWCAERESCVRCSTLRHCGPGLSSMRHWTGYGTNWHACRLR